NCKNPTLHNNRRRLSLQHGELPRWARPRMLPFDRLLNPTSTPGHSTPESKRLRPRQVSVPHPKNNNETNQSWRREICRGLLPPQQGQPLIPRNSSAFDLPSRLEESSNCARQAVKKEAALPASAPLYVRQENSATSETFSIIRCAILHQPQRTQAAF